MTVTTVRTPPVLRAGMLGGPYHAVEHGPRGLAPITHCGRTVSDSWIVYAHHTPVTCRSCLKVR